LWKTRGLFRQKKEKSATCNLVPQGKGARLRKNTDECCGGGKKLKKKGLPKNRHRKARPPPLNKGDRESKGTVRFPYGLQRKNVVEA